jgi:hypothetical protein
VIFHDVLDASRAKAETRLDQLRAVLGKPRATAAVASFFDRREHDSGLPNVA